VATKPQRTRASPQNSLFAEPTNEGVDSSAHAPLPFSDEENGPHQRRVKRATIDAQVVSDSALRKADGDLKDLVRHPVEMAAIVPMTRRMTFLSRKVWAFLVSYSLSSEGTRTELGILWRVAMTTLERDIEYNSNDKNTLRESIRECQRTLVDWAGSAKDSTTGETHTWKSSQLLGGVDFVIDNSGRMCVEWSFPQNLLKQMREFKHDFEWSARILVSFNKQSTAALYWVVSRYKTSPSGLTNRLPWREWIPILTGQSVEDAENEARVIAAKKGVSAHAKYAEWRYFKRDVVDKAVDELNQVLEDIWVEARPIKVGKTVEELQFKVTPRVGYKKPAASGAVGNISPETQEAVDAMSRLGLTKKFARQLAIEHGAARTLKVAADVQRRVDDGTQAVIKNRQGFFISQLQEAVKAAEAAAAKSEPTPAPTASVDELADQSLNDYRSMLQDKARQEWPAHPVEVRDDYLKRFGESYIPGTPESVRREFEKKGIKSPIVAGRFYAWLAHDIAGADWEPSHKVLVAFERGQRPTAQKVF
jgi:hypothetical protein